MICPGVKRPPPMGSELSSGLLLAGVCGVRREERDGVFRVTGDAGATVAPSRLAPSPRTVALVSESTASPHEEQDRKSTRLNSSHSQISYAVFCLKQKKQYYHTFLRSCK